MKVQVIHETPNGARTDFGVYNLTHMPPIAEPFPIDSNTFYLTKAYSGPDEAGMYQLVIEGEPKTIQ